MNGYRAPTTDMRFTLEHVIGLETLTSIEAFSHIDSDLIAGILDEAGRFAAEVLAPLARDGDTIGSVRNDDGSVTTPPGYKEAYKRYVAAGWPGAAFPEEIGGGGLPWVIGLAIQEMATTADLAFSLCPMLTYGTNDLLMEHGSEPQRATYLEKLVAGEWAGTMVLTEPQAGSDLGAILTKATPGDDGAWRITGTKIFITWGEHDLTDNIVHLVLARTPGGPPGTKGISCFIVPKFLVNDDGSLGDRNDVTCVSLEHKLGIHASPTCVLSFGDSSDGAIGYLVGEEKRGMRYMFTMMNNARVAVGLQGLAVTERSYQQAAAYALERRQGHTIDGDRSEMAVIVGHPDVRRMLMLMRSNAEAMRGVLYRNAMAIDLAHHHPDETVQSREADLAAILTPIAKAWASDLGVELTSLGLQIHGGAGYIEETGAAQWWRDSRIAPIYEGTNGIQAQDLVLRKIPLDGGAAIKRLLKTVAADAAALEGDLKPVGEHLTEAVEAVAEVALAFGDLLTGGRFDDVLAGATPFLKMIGDTLGGWMLARGAAAAAEAPAGFDAEFLADRITTASFYAEQVLPTVAAGRSAALAGAPRLFAIEGDRF